MKNRTFQRLFPLLRTGSILLAVVLFCAALVGVNAQLTVGTNEERNLATYLGLALTVVVAYLLQDVPKMLVGRHLGWKLVRYEAFGRVYQADGTGAFVRVPEPARKRLRYQPYLLPPEDASRHDVTLYMLCPLLYGGMLAVLFGALTLLTLGQPVSLVLCELAMGGVVLVLACLLPMDEGDLASLPTMVHWMRDPQQLAEWVTLMRNRIRELDKLEGVGLEDIPNPQQIRTGLDGVALVWRMQNLLLEEQNSQAAYALAKRMLDNEVRVPPLTWNCVLLCGVTAELLLGEPSEFAALYQSKTGKGARQNVFSSVDGALAGYAVTMLVTHEAREAEVLRELLNTVREKMLGVDGLMKKIEEKAARTES